MKTEQLDRYVTQFTPENKTDFHSLSNMTHAMFKLNNGTLFTSRTASQYTREQFGVYVDPHIMLEILERLVRLDILEYDRVKEGEQVYILK